MHKIYKNIFTVLAITSGLILLCVIILFITGICLYRTADFREPVLDFTLENDALIQKDSLRTYGSNSLLLNNSGLLEIRLSGSPFQRGAAYGILSQDLLEYQENVFVEKIRDIIKSDKYMSLLHKLIIIFNRNMSEYIPEELREEIYGISLSCSDKFDAFGTSYERQLNYHAAHDIGHAMQEYMLVGCSSFAVWGDNSIDGELLIGRNFDFYINDNFAKNRVILFVEPDSGYRFVSVSWPGMIGVVSGMNAKGLTVTINAAKGPLPTSAAMPISLLARQILQYASNITEAYNIATSVDVFVSESILIGSAEDGFAAIIEKSPEHTSLYTTSRTAVICTNHYQSDTFMTDPHNLKNISTSDSPYRYERINELIDSLSPIDQIDAAYILRNRFGTNNTDIGLTNEKSINQFISHHSVIFQPEKLRMWVSTNPWQAGEYICYDLTEGRRLKAMTIPADSTIITHDIPNVLLYRQLAAIIQESINNGVSVPREYLEVLLSVNPEYYGTYRIIGDYMSAAGDRKAAVQMWKTALQKETAHKKDRLELERKIHKYDY